MLEIYGEVDLHSNAIFFNQNLIIFKEACNLMNLTNKNADSELLHKLELLNQARQTNSIFVDVPDSSKWSHFGDALFYNRVDLSFLKSFEFKSHWPRSNPYGNYFYSGLHKQLIYNNAGNLHLGFHSKENLVQSIENLRL